VNDLAARVVDILQGVPTVPGQTTSAA